MSSLIDPILVNVKLSVDPLNVVLVDHPVGKGIMQECLTLEEDRFFKRFITGDHFQFGIVQRFRKNIIVDDLQRFTTLILGHCKLRLKHKDVAKEVVVAALGLGEVQLGGDWVHPQRQFVIFANFRIYLTPLTPAFFTVNLQHLWHTACLDVCR